MTRLLVSVRSAAEARRALQGGAQIIDVKEPRAGSLGAADSGVCLEVLEAVGGRVPVSMALGELLETPSTTPLGPVPGAMAFAKLGLAGAAPLPDWGSLWKRRCRELPATTRPVAVIYADWQAAAAPSPRDVLQLADEAGCGVLLIDTSDKRHGDLFAHLSPGRLREILQAARAAGLQVVLAGSLRGAAIEHALALRPDVLAVRGAVCHPDRQGALRTAKVARLAERLRNASRSCQDGP